MTEQEPTILVVDDTAINRDLLHRRLRREGFQVVEAADGQTALNIVAERSVDMVLLDVMMPGMSGLEVLDRLRASHGLMELPVLMVTALDGSADVVRALAQGANDYVTKPIDMAVLMARLRTHLRVKRLAALKDQFLAIASHDLKNPLTAIFGISRLLTAVVEPGQPLSEDAVALLGDIERAARRMQEMIENVLDLHMLSEGQADMTLEKLDVGAIARDLARGNSHYAASKTIALSVTLPDDMPQVKGEPLRLNQVLQNLIDNAIKYTPRGGSVEVRAVVEGERVLIEVVDSGPGFTAADLPRVLAGEVGRVNLPTGGEKSTGLGLSIARRFMHAQHGELGVRNNPEGGATFWIGLPAAGSGTPKA